MRRKKLIIHKGEIRGIYHDGESQKLVKLLGCEASVERASRVEAKPGKNESIEFEVDLALSNGPKVDGFKTYREAVEFEIEWLNNNRYTKKKENQNK